MVFPSGENATLETLEAALIVPWALPVSAFQRIAVSLAASNEATTFPLGA